MPALAALIQTLFGALATFLAKLFLAKLAIRIAAVSAIVAAGGVLMTAFNNQVAPMVAQMFNSEYGQFIGLAFPPIAGTCIAAITAVWFACTTYSLQVRAIKVTANM